MCPYTCTIISGDGTANNENCHPEDMQQHLAAHRTPFLGGQVNKDNKSRFRIKSKCLDCQTHQEEFEKKDVLIVPQAITPEHVYCSYP